MLTFRQALVAISTALWYDSSYKLWIYYVHAYLFTYLPRNVKKRRIKHQARGCSLYI